MLYVFLLILLSSSYSKKTYEKKCAKPECGCYSPYLSSECTDENHWLIHATIPSCSYNPNVCTNACGGIWCDGTGFPNRKYVLKIKNDEIITPIV